MGAPLRRFPDFGIYPPGMFGIEAAAQHLVDRIGLRQLRVAYGPPEARCVAVVGQQTVEVDLRAFLRLAAELVVDASGDEVRFLVESVVLQIHVRVARELVGRVADQPQTAYVVEQFDV